MTKQPEEGEIWEWRAFGTISGTLAARVRAYPARFGANDLRGDDIYLMAPKNDQNVKLRRSPGASVLKLKLLLETAEGNFERYRESVDFTYRFPISLNRVKQAAQLLEVTLPDSVLALPDFAEGDFVDALVKSSPGIAVVQVSKKRSQYQFNNGWLELADVTFATQQVQSISIHSPDIDAVKDMLDHLRVDQRLQPMNYIDACRRWGSAAQSVS